MKRIITVALLVLWSIAASAQSVPALEELKEDPRKAYGTDYPYGFKTEPITPSPRGYKPFYITGYARHGSRYYWNDRLYKQLDTLLLLAHQKNLLTDEGEEFYANFLDAKQELMTGISELTDLGWQQHQQISRTMYGRFPEVFRKGGNVLAISSLSGRCVMSMSAFCQELVQCNPKIEVREQSSRFTLDGVIPGDKENPAYREWPKAKPRYEANRSSFTYDNSLNDKIISRVFKSTEGLPGNISQIAGNLVSLYTSLPNIGHEGMMGDILTDEDIVRNWESSNLGSYSWVFGDQYKTIPILEDIIKKADAVLQGTSDRIADFRFGHDSYIGPLTVLMGLDGADLDPEDPYKVKDVYQNWKTCKASTIHLVFYRSRKAGQDILVKCLLNGYEVTLPVHTDNFPYYKWSDLRSFYLQKIGSVEDQIASQ
ncbi:MAG: hypothetical protein IJ584_16270 [Bacteroidales bacterium]|nr:hypothetical protein [Bacteroidales bacterium]